jgi:hypothetical protein
MSMKLKKSLKKILIDLNTHSNMKIDADSIVKETIDIFIKAGGFEILKNCWKNF